MPNVLSNIRVLDLTRVLAGPWGTQILADLGAEVIKVERPKTGDDTRAWGPPYLRDAEGRNTTEAAYFLSANRGKQSLSLNVASPEGQDIIRKLVKDCDVFVENYKVGDMARYGLGYDDLKKFNPGLIYCSVTGFGQTGPMSHLPGYDFIIQAMGGLMSITGERDDLPSGGPQKVGIAVSDIFTGLYATIAILAALSYRSQTGKGQYIDMALLDVQVATMANMNMNFLTSGVVPHRQGNAHANIVPYQVFDAKDGQFIIAVGNDSQFAKLCQVLETPDLATDERYATNANRVRNRERLVPLLQEILSRRSVSEWISLIEPQGIPCGAINNIAQVFGHPQVKHRGMKIEVSHPLVGSLPLVANPIKFSETPIAYEKAPPTLGQHTKQILTKLAGMTEREIEDLSKKGVV